MKKLIEIVDRDTEESYGLNMNSLVDSDGTDRGIIQIDTGRKRGPGRPPKNSQQITYTDIVVSDNDNKKRKEDTFEKQLEKNYQPQAALTLGIMQQTEEMYQDIKQELDKYKANQHFGGKSRGITMSNLMNTQVSLLGTKLNAVREMNNMRNKINDLVMQNNRLMKDTGEENSDKQILDAYYALINAPRYGLPTAQAPLHPASINTGINLNGNAIMTQNIVPADNSISNNNIETGFDSDNLNPVQKRMLIEQNPSIKTVVVYNQSTGNKYFDVVDVNTGRSIPGIQRPAPFLLDDMKIDPRTGLASNSNANMTFPLVITGTKAYDEL